MNSSATGPSHVDIAVNPPDSLTRFDAPLFVGVERSAPRDPAAASAAFGAAPGGAKLTAAGADASNKLDDMINSMLPPREWVEESGVWMQYVSKEPASRFDVIALQERMDKKLAERKARETGICPVREEVYAQCFDELIRQVALDGPERGLLLMRTRDEIRMTVDAYKALYASSVTFGIKKELQAEQGVPGLEEEAAALERENAALELEVQELRSKLDIVEKREAERRAIEERRRKEELDFLKHQGQHLDSFLKQMNANK